MCSVLETGSGVPGTEGWNASVLAACQQSNHLKLDPHSKTLVFDKDLLLAHATWAILTPPPLEIALGATVDH